MSLVGDIIMDLRARIPDAPSVSNAPFILSVTPITVGGGTLTGEQSFAVTGVNNWGETPVSAASVTTVAMGTNNAVDISVQSSPYNLLANNIYQSGSYAGDPSALFDKWTFPISPSGFDTYQISGFGTAAPVLANPPLRNTAFHPDTDGNFIGAYTAYRLLNRALQEMVKIAGGIVDVTGVRSTINTSMYRLQSPFYTFVNAWYDGYPMDVVPRNFMFLRNSAAGFSGILSYEQDGPQQVIQVWPQSNRNGGLNSLYQVMGVNDNFFLVNNSTGFLSIGLAQIDSEIVGFSAVTPQPTVGPTVATFGGVIRGLGGTTIVQHQIGAPVQELNIRLSGYRLAQQYNVGDAMQTLMVPQSWETPLVLHMLSQVRSMEQDEATSKALLGDFVQMAEKIAKGSRLGRVKPRQIPIWGQQGSDARNVNGIGFGWLVN